MNKAHRRDRSFHKPILVIEDSDISMDLMIFMLNSMGYRVIPALNGPAGLAIARSERPCLIICDIQMQELDGYGVLAALKSDASLRHIPLVAVTGMAMAGAADMLLERGFDGYLAKPIDLHALKLEVERHLNG